MRPVCKDCSFVTYTFTRALCIGHMYLGCILFLTSYRFYHSLTSLPASSPALCQFSLHNAARITFLKSTSYHVVNFFKILQIIINDSYIRAKVLNMVSKVFCDLTSVHLYPHLLPLVSCQICLTTYSFWSIPYFFISLSLQML